MFSKANKLKMTIYIAFSKANKVILTTHLSALETATIATSGALH